MKTCVLQKEIYIFSMNLLAEQKKKKTVLATRNKALAMSLAFDLAALVVIVIHTQQCCDVNVL
jgi:hypothetical protein